MSAKGDTDQGVDEGRSSTIQVNQPLRPPDLAAFLQRPEVPETFLPNEESLKALEWTFGQPNSITALKEWVRLSFKGALGNSWTASISA